MGRTKEVDSNVIEDYDTIRRLIEALVEIRRNNCTQKDVAKSMATSQGAVSAIERMAFDSRLLTIMLYARAVGYRVTGFTIEPIEFHQMSLVSHQEVA